MLVLVLLLLVLLLLLTSLTLRLLPLVLLLLLLLVHHRCCWRRIHARALPPSVSARRRLRDEGML